METILNLTDKEYDEYSKKCAEIHLNDKAGWEIAFDTMRTLGLGGLWRGLEAGIVIIYNSAKKIEAAKSASNI